MVLTCPACHHDESSDDARFCPHCGAKLPNTARRELTASVRQEVGRTGQVTCFQVGPVDGNVSIDQIDQTWTTMIQGDEFPILLQQDPTR